MPQLAVRTRSGRVESIHDGYVCVTDSDKNIVGCIGNPEVRIYMRSSGKPILAVAFVKSGAIEKFDITLKELAVICSSHSGQAFHRRAIRSILHKVGLSEKDLECGHKDPENENVKNALIKLGKRPSPIFSCCSGKHAGMLALCQYYNYPIKGYTEPDHPLQLLIKKIMAELLECDEKDAIFGKDGCTLPTYNLSMYEASYLYALLALGYEGKGKYKDCFGLIQKAMKTYPRMVNGDDTICTDLSNHSKGKVVGKIGAEGIYCVSIPEKHMGVCLKISDGHPWASYPVTIKVLQDMGLLDEGAVKKLEKWAYPTVIDDKGNTVGYLHTTFSILTNETSNYEIGDQYPMRTGVKLEQTTGQKSIKYEERNEFV